MTNKTIYPAPLLCDFYKVSHREQYPQGTEIVYSTWTPRTSRMVTVDRVVAFGFQGFIKEYLIDYFDAHFFGREKATVIGEYTRYLKHALQIADPHTKHLEDLHDLGYLPIKIKAVSEGTTVPIRTPMLTIENTHKDFFWLTNFLETIMSCYLWQPSTSATIAKEYKKILTKWAKHTGGDLGFVQFQGHDFSMRGMGALGSACTSGAGHLLSFVGTDTIPAISYLAAYYNADIDNELVGCSVPASEHSVMCAGGKDDEYDTYRRLIEDIYPNGIVSIVSDTWDLWHVLTDTIPKLKDTILARDGKVVIRPDSGDPVDIICGELHNVDISTPAAKGVIELLWDTFGGTVNAAGFKELDSHIGAIYGDSITLDRAEAICYRLAAKGFASTNIVFGIGSYTYQYNTRDTFGFALKSTYVVNNGEEINIFKDPATDDGTKKSQTGRVIVTSDGYTDGLTKAHEMQLAEDNLLCTIFKDGVLKVDMTLSQVRNNMELSNV